MIICHENQCTGCAACLCSCPTHAISMRENHEGFLIPLVDEDKCTRCDLCRKACPVLNEIQLYRFDSPEVYAAWSLDESIRTDSSSGGIFSVMAEHIISETGIVFGAAFDSELKLHHHEVMCKNDLSKLRGSKYLQSNIKDVYIKAKRYLDIGTKVMFVGTPCQVAGLYGYLRKEYPTLITCDLLCHGVPSQRFFDQYLNYLRQNGYTQFDDISFRDKRHWGLATILIEHTLSKKEIFLTERHNYYQQAYLRGLIYRKSCYSCKYAKLPRVGDLTLGDFWGIGKDTPFHHDPSQGVSLFLVNSRRGRELMQACRNGMFFEKRRLIEAKKMNPQVYRASEYPKRRDSFFVDIETLPLEKIIKKYQLKKKITTREILHKSIRSVIGQNGIDVLKKLLKRLSKWLKSLS